MRVDCHLALALMSFYKPKLNIISTYLHCKSPLWSHSRANILGFAHKCSIIENADSPLLPWQTNSFFSLMCKTIWSGVTPILPHQISFHILYFFYIDPMGLFIYPYRISNQAVKLSLIKLYLAF